MGPCRYGSLRTRTARLPPANPLNDARGSATLEFEFTGTVFEWRGPAPHHFIAVPDGPGEMIRAAAGALSYGWGVIPVHARVGKTRFSTSLFPKDGRYLLPLKLDVRRREGIGIGDTIQVEMQTAR